MLVGSLLDPDAFSYHGPLINNKSLRQCGFLFLNNSFDIDSSICSSNTLMKKGLLSYANHFPNKVFYSRGIR
jgi:hypothetical protein